MANLKEQALWEDGIYQIEKNDPVVGGEDGISNRQGKQLANRTAFLKQELDKKANAEELTTGLNRKANSQHSHSEYAPKKSPALTGIPTAPTAEYGTNNEQIATTKFVVETIDKKISNEHNHEIDDINGLEDALNEAGKKGLPVGAIVAFPGAVTNPTGFLKCNGTNFSQLIYPDLYRVLGNKTKLPNLTRSDVGMTAYFAVDQIPDGWLAFDDIATRVTNSTYPELYQYLIAKYGSISAVPKAEDRFLRNNGNGLRVGQTQDDAIRNITGTMLFSEMIHGVQSDGAFSEERISRPNTYRVQGSGYTSTVTFDASKVVPTANENRPKSLVLKLCIKAKNSFDDVQFWIKAFGTVENQGMMDASQISHALQGKADAADLRNKANLNHQHKYADISDFNDGVKSSFTQQLAENGWCKLPNGLIEQWGKVTLNQGGGSGIDTQVVFPISFAHELFNVTVSYGLMTNKRLTQDTVLSALSLQGMTIRQHQDREVVVYWRAIGI